MKMKFGVVVFPGSNCDDDMVHVLGQVMNCDVVKLWHKSESLSGLTDNDCIIIPGGFSYGDYLRAGAIARFSPIMKSVVDFATKGGLVFGICNGFQILCEAGLLPGVLLRNKNQRFISKNVFLKTENFNTKLTSSILPSTTISMPVAHAEGRYFADPQTISTLESNNQVLFRYADHQGNVTSASNINGSLNNIAGICNLNGNVFGMMPHPERAAESIIGCADGRALFESLIDVKENVMS